jgi:hypothetical protein
MRRTDGHGKASSHVFCRFESYLWVQYARNSLTAAIVPWAWCLLSGGPRFGSRTLTGVRNGDIWVTVNSRVPRRDVDHLPEPRRAATPGCRYVEWIPWTSAVLLGKVQGKAKDVIHIVSLGSLYDWSYTFTPQYVFMAWCLIKQDTSSRRDSYLIKKHIFMTC